MIYKMLAGDTWSQYHAWVDNKDWLLDYRANFIFLPKQERQVTVVSASEPHSKYR